MDALTTIATERSLNPLLSSLSTNTQRVYRSKIAQYQLYLARNNLALCRESAQLYLAQLRTTPSSLNQHLAAIKRLAREADDNGWIESSIAARIRTIGSKKAAGTRTGKWLSLEQAKLLLAAPDRTTAKGKRDLAVLALFLGTGMRRAELAQLDWENVVERPDGCYVENILGKGGRIRTMKLPSWTVSILMDWKQELEKQCQLK